MSRAFFIHEITSEVPACRDSTDSEIARLISVWRGYLTAAAVCLTHRDSGSLPCSRLSTERGAEQSSTCRSCHLFMISRAIVYDFATLTTAAAAAAAATVALRDERAARSLRWFSLPVLINMCEK